MKKITVLLFLLPVFCHAQRVFKSDFENFLITRDSILATTDTAKQLEMINRLYISKASEGLIAFMRNKDHLDSKWLAVIKATPFFWDSLKMKMPVIDTAVIALEKQILRLQNLYPGLKPAQTYFLVGLRQQGGTIRGNISIIGVEVVLGNATTKGNQLVGMGIHEYIHTQQKRPDFQKINVLTSSIREGACDFIAHIVTDMPIKSSYMDYGTKHEQEVWLSFQTEMYTQNNDNWVSTGKNAALPAPDLGYFVGYRICKAYYDRATDKKTAIKEIIELDYADSTVVSDFLKQSGYNGDK